MTPYKERTLQELTERYQELCYGLGRDKDARDVPNSREELIKRLGELNFEWYHEYHIS